MIDTFATSQNLEKNLNPNFVGLGGGRKAKKNLEVALKEILLTFLNHVIQAQIVCVLEKGA
jgi:hypothetical protein